ncbi:hypothetical protein [Polaromonas vacuolata]|uniref:hypothetical protein n=1 Tax=Polaromonas vacuolata TaxID=37448 RepID=UPI00145644DA|nr:hypothetical protein [Polaromonas vacuolata]
MANNSFERGFSGASEITGEITGCITGDSIGDSTGAIGVIGVITGELLCVVGAVAMCRFTGFICYSFRFVIHYAFYV